MPSPKDLPDPAIEPTTLPPPALAGRVFTTNATWEAQRVPYLVSFHREETWDSQKWVACSGHISSNRKRGFKPSLPKPRAEVWAHCILCIFCILLAMGIQTPGFLAVYKGAAKGWSQHPVWITYITLQPLGYGPEAKNSLYQIFPQSSHLSPLQGNKNLWCREMQIKTSMRYRYIPVRWLLSKSLQAINAGEGVEKREPSYTVGGNAN